MKSAQSTIRYRNVQLLLTIEGITGIAVWFLPFTFNITPLQAIGLGELWKLVVPPFVSIFVLFAALRRIFLGAFTKTEKESFTALVE